MILEKLHALAKYYNIILENKKVKCNKGKEEGKRLTESEVMAR